VQSLRIQGLVRLANRVRGELASQPTSARRQQLRQHVANALRHVDRILVTHATRLDQLPAPTRRAYTFLAELDFDGPIPPSPSVSPATGGSVSLVRLTSFWQHLLDRLARLSAAAEPTALHESVRSASQNIERYLQDEGLAPAHLTPQSRAIRGWLAFFAERENLDAYIAALRLAAPILEAGVRAQARFVPPLLIHFRSLPGLYRVRGYRDGTRLALPTPMIAFDVEGFAALADLIFRGGQCKRRLMELLAGEACQNIRAELDALSGVVEQTTGAFHDLAAAFERVHARYFDGALPRPQLTWSRTFTGRKFGHYDPIRDTVMISSSLDRGDVPACVLDFVMYHELLHKQLGVDWRAGRALVHTPEFRAAEQRFADHGEAEQHLKRLAAEVRSS